MPNETAETVQTREVTNPHTLRMISLFSAFNERVVYRHQLNNIETATPGTYFQNLDKNASAKQRSDGDIPSNNNS